MNKIKNIEEIEKKCGNIIEEIKECIYGEYHNPNIYNYDALKKICSITKQFEELK